MRARVVVFKVVAEGSTVLETDSLSAAIERCRRVRQEGIAARIEQFRANTWPPPRRAIA